MRVRFIVINKATGEIEQKCRGSLIAFNVHPIKPNQDKIIVDEKDAEKLLTENIDFDKGKWMWNYDKAERKFKVKDGYEIKPGEKVPERKQK